MSGLLDELEVPRAISAPPHLDDRWAAQLVRRRLPNHRLRAARLICNLVQGEVKSAARGRRACAPERRRWERAPAAPAPPPTPSLPRPASRRQSQLSGASGDASKLGAALGDIRLDEDYDRFYRAQVLPPFQMAASSSVAPPPPPPQCMHACMYSRGAAACLVCARRVLRLRRHVS